MTKSKSDGTSEAERLWKQCHNDTDLSWMLESVLSSRIPALGRILLLSQLEFFGQIKVQAGRNLSLLFELAGLPFLSAGVNELAQSLRRMSAAKDSPLRSDTQRAIEEWGAANGKQARDLVVAAALETVRRNTELRKLIEADQPITAVRVAQELPPHESLDWGAFDELITLFEPFLMRPRSKKPINRITLDFTALLRHAQPTISQLDIAFRSALHFSQLLKKRGVGEKAWRDVVMKLLSRELLLPFTPMYLWCRECPQDGFVASLPFSLCPLPPLCPGCGKAAHAIASYRPARGFDTAVKLKDGLLGAAIGWHLAKRKIRFRHSPVVNGTEMDFVAQDLRGSILVECKMLSVAPSEKQLIRTLRDAASQLAEHAEILEQSGSKVVAAVCVVNSGALQLRRLSTRKDTRFSLKRIISYEDFASWFRSHHRR